jgi:AMIN domain
VPIWVLALPLLAVSALERTTASAQTAPPAPPPAQPSQTDQTPQPSRSTAIREWIKQSQERRRLGRMQPGSAPAGAKSAQPGSTAPAPTSSIPQQASTRPPTAAPASVAKPATVPGPKQAAAIVKNVEIVHDKGGSAIAIMMSRPIPPALQTLNDPPRLVIDLPNAHVAVKQRHLTAQGEQFTDIRVDQFQVTPPVTRVVVDLTSPRQYTWDAAGNRLMIRLKPVEEAKPRTAPAPAAQPTTVSTFSAGVQPAVVPVTPRPSGSMVLAGSRIGSGSSVTASEETAVLHIARGGEVHVCPRTTVSVTASKNGQELMLGMSSGALETHYHLEATADAVLTPDFRILLAGPGDFDYAIATNSHGDTCIRALLGNTASVLVSELMGDRTYQVKPTEQVVFQDGRVDRISNDLPVDCGCAAPPLPVMRASAAPPPTTVSDANLPPNVHLQTTPVTRAALDPMLPPMPAPATRAAMDPMLPPLPSHHPPSQGALASTNPASAHLPTSKPEDIHVQVEAPFVFRRPDPTQGQTQAAARSVAPKPSATARLDPTAPLPTEMPPPTPPAPPEQPKKKAEHRGFFGKVKGMFSSMFR